MLQIVFEYFVEMSRKQAVKLKNVPHRTPKMTFERKMPTIIQTLMVILESGG